MDIPIRRYKEKMRSKKRSAPLLFISLSALTFLTITSSLYGQTKKDTLTFRVMGYNVENLFDCRHDTLKNDYEFLPDAVRHWNYSKYKKKLDAVARVIIAVGEWSPPALVALCEVENDSVLRDLTRYSVLREADYRYVITHSPDERGINVALLYQRGLFKLLSGQSYSVTKAHKSNRPTRDILHVSGLLLNKDTLDVFVVHFPSRSGGAKVSEPYRLSAAQRLKEVTDSLFRVRTHPQIIVMGDFNDYPCNKSVQKILRAGVPPIEADSSDTRALYHLLARKSIADKHFGSYKYQGEWGLLDHIILSGNLLITDSPLSTAEAKAGIFSAPFLLTEDKKYGDSQPFRTYYGMKYQAGYSDHLPVWAEFTLRY
ncbi:endonuclease/exonuclease/phosphatase family protein [Bacteroides clarus]|uniref:Endonuclease n=1 Tax=Bacteroides clarus TaxID=626929 RepID=A0A412YGF4_9BACE|nr:endonuclease/exonuclease/phosphatase family protein [Bacteroides clarus]RGV39819.1 endonuclease [Bacteroides clarus]RGV56491.1 endonuclease [Bacteroides clarus]